MSVVKIKRFFKFGSIIIKKKTNPKNRTTFHLIFNNMNTVRFKCSLCVNVKTKAF